MVLADEPTGELDETAAAQIMALLRRHAEHSACVVLVTHNPDLALLADREIALRDGSIVS